MCTALVPQRTSFGESRCVPLQCRACKERVRPVNGAQPTDDRRGAQGACAGCRLAALSLARRAKARPSTRRPQGARPRVVRDNVSSDVESLSLQTVLSTCATGGGASTTPVPTTSIADSHSMRRKNHWRPRAASSGTVSVSSMSVYATGARNLSSSERTMSLNSPSFSHRSSMVFTACMTVVWSRPPK